tara:strand:- start:5766 stop:6401 length:636 start_codon:yes stop_codon:yes gene_type:complete
MSREFIKTPITVNKKMEICDGQHRFTAIKALGLPIFYRVSTENLDTIRTMNQNNKNWTFDDYLASFVALESRQEGNIGPYTQFNVFKKQTKLPNAVCLAMLKGNKSKTATTDFKNGKFEIPPGQFGVATKQAKMIMEVGDYYDGYRKAKFIMAMLSLFQDEQFSFKKFIKKLSMNRNKLYHCVNTLDYIDAIERLYNWGNATKVKFRRYHA